MSYFGDSAKNVAKPSINETAAGFCQPDLWSVYLFLNAGSVLWLFGVMSWIFWGTGQNSVLVTAGWAGGSVDDPPPGGLSLNRLTQIHLKPACLCWDTYELFSQQQIRRDTATEQWTHICDLVL